MFLPDLVARCAGLVLRFPISKAAVVVTSDQRFPGAGGADRDGLIFSHSLHGGGAESRLCWRLEGWRGEGCKHSRKMQ